MAGCDERFTRTTTALMMESIHLPPGGHGGYNGGNYWLNVLEYNKYLAGWNERHNSNLTVFDMRLKVYD
jgi:hypothetical protein